MILILILILKRHNYHSHMKIYHVHTLLMLSTQFSIVLSTSNRKVCSIEISYTKHIEFISVWVQLATDHDSSTFIESNEWYSSTFCIHRLQIDKFKLFHICIQQIFSSNDDLIADSHPFILAYYAYWPL